MIKFTLCGLMHARLPTATATLTATLTSYHTLSSGSRTPALVLSCSADSASRSRHVLLAAVPLSL